jgi:hypothetical protein
MVLYLIYSNGYRRSRAKYQQIHRETQRWISDSIDRKGPVKQTSQTLIIYTYAPAFTGASFDHIDELRKIARHKGDGNF